MPKAAPRPCTKHPAILVTKDKPCPECPAHGWKPDKVRGTSTERGYGAAWRKLRDRILKRDNYRCQPCKQKGRFKAATAVDHILNKERGGTDDPDNLQAICTDCHKAKTAKER